MSFGARWSLRKRLVIATVALLAVIGIVTGVATVFALHSFLIARVDDQLTAAVARSQDAVRRPPTTEAARPTLERLLPGLGAEALGLLAVGDRIAQDGYLSETGERQRLDAEQQQALLAIVPGDAPSTVDLGDLGEYRVIAREVDSAATVVIGLPLAEVNAITANLTGTIALVTALGILAAAAAGTVVVRLALRPLDRVAATATRVSQQQLDRGRVSLDERVPIQDTAESTEVGRVGAALNRLLDHVASALDARERSESKVRQFVADASHELRTPLASIRGYSELTRRAPYELPEDLSHALSRIESESVRMTRLVEDLLTLARLDEGRPLVKEPVDLAELLADVVADAEAAGPEHEWQLTLPAGQVVVQADRAQLHQVLANLLSNARMHTPPGTTVRASVEAEGSTATVAVEDTGPGVPQEIRPTLFERFVRGDSSRSRAAGSSGLGLAIASAIVAAHGGQFRVESEPGLTRFLVVLPLP